MQDPIVKAIMNQGHTDLIKALVAWFKASEQGCSEASVKLFALKTELQKFDPSLSIPTADIESMHAGVSPGWVLTALAGMSFPKQGDAYDYMRRLLKASEETEKDSE